MEEADLPGSVGILLKFGAAEIAGMIAPRTLIVEACAGPRVDFVPAKRPVTTALAQTADLSLPLSTTFKER